MTQTFRLLSLLLAAIVAVTLLGLGGDRLGVAALKCYRGQQNASMPVVGEPQECAPGSMTCTKIYEPSMNIAQRECSASNCTLNNMISSVGTCQNSTSYPYNTYCCCYGDGCNSAPRRAVSVEWQSMAFGALLLVGTALALGPSLGATSAAAHRL